MQIINLKLRVMDAIMKALELGIQKLNKETTPKNLVEFSRIYDKCLDIQLLLLKSGDLNIYRLGLQLEKDLSNASSAYKAAREKLGI